MLHPHVTGNIGIIGCVSVHGKLVVDTSLSQANFRLGMAPRGHQSHGILLVARAVHPLGFWDGLEFVRRPHGAASSPSLRRARIVYAPLHTFRIDSLLAVELCNWIGKEFVADVAVLDVMEGATLAMVDLLVATKSQLSHLLWA